jgi:hypothetical protein
MYPDGDGAISSADDDSWTHIKRFISECDYYVVIVGGRYGSMGKDGKSYTEMEYDFATEAGIPVLAFLHKSPGTIAANKTESSDDGKKALTAFRTKIEAARHAKYWAGSELPGIVIQGMLALTEAKPRVGWIRADRVSDASAPELLKLRRRIEELELIEQTDHFKPPPGTETLAQGNETITLHFRYEGETGYRDAKELFSWNELFSAVGPLLITQSRDTTLRNQINGVFESRFHDRTGEKIRNAYFRDEEFQAIKLQLRALGLMAESSVLGMWKLTPYGDHLLTQVAAIKSSATKA